MGIKLRENEILNSELNKSLFISAESSILWESKAAKQKFYFDRTKFTKSFSPFPPYNTFCVHEKRWKVRPSKNMKIKRKKVQSFSQRRKAKRLQITKIWKN